MVPERGLFFVMPQYSKMTDLELVMLYRLNDETAQQVLVYRYRGFSFILACGLFDRYSRYATIEISDMVSIGLIALHRAVMSFDFESEARVIYPLWRTIALNDMKKYVMQNFVIKEDGTRFISSVTTSGDSLNIPVHDTTPLESEIIDFLSNPANEISKRNQKIFLCYLTGLTYAEISRKFNISFATTKRVIEEIRVKLIKRLF